MVHLVLVPPLGKPPQKESKAMRSVSTGTSGASCPVYTRVAESFRKEVLIRRQKPSAKSKNRRACARRQQFASQRALSLLFTTLQHRHFPTAEDTKDSISPATVILEGSNSNSSIPSGFRSKFRRRAVVRLAVKAQLRQTNILDNKTNKAHASIRDIQNIHGRFRATRTRCFLVMVLPGSSAARTAARASRQAITRVRR